MNELYTAHVSDKVTVSVTFVKDNRIVKTMSDYGENAPAEFFWAYEPVRYLYQQLDLDTISKSEVDYLFYNATLEYNNTSYDLNQSEGFHLWNLILKSKKTQSKFASKYILKAYGPGGGKFIETDGRFYKFDFGDGKTETYDIGFDFISANGLTKKFVNRDEFYKMLGKP